MIQFLGDGSDGDRFLSVDEYGNNFSFSRGRYDVAHDLGDSVDGSVESGHGG